MRKITAALIAPLAFLTACTNSYELRYKADPQPRDRQLFADYARLQDSIAISIDTNGHRLDDIYVRKPDNTIIRPTRIDYPGYGSSASFGPGVGVGPVGVGIGFPIGPKHVEGLTTAAFHIDSLGPPPWEVHVEVYGTPKATIPGVGGPQPSSNRPCTPPHPHQKFNVAPWSTLMFPSPSSDPDAFTVHVISVRFGKF